MKIIAISNLIPAENQDGTRLIAYHRLLHMAKLGHSIDLVCFQSKNKKNDYSLKRILEKKGISVHFIKWNIFEAIYNLLLGLLSGLPLQCSLFKSKQFSKKIKKIFEAGKIDAIYCVMIRVALNINWYDGKIFVDMVDSMGLNFFRRYKYSKGLKKWILKKEKKRVSNYEKKLANISKFSFVVSAIDKKNIGSSKVKVIPQGVKFYNKKRKIKKNPIIIFTGNMYYAPNIDAITWFIKNCWFNILKKEPKSKLFIVGNNPSPEIISMSLTYPSIKLTGRVPSIMNFLSKATVAIAPMQSGSGIQNKILESMSCSVPVVTTKIGFGDLNAVPRKDLFVADNANDFFKKVIYLIRSRKKNIIIGKNGQKYVRKYHNWKNLNQTFINFLNT